MAAMATLFERLHNAGGSPPAKKTTERRPKNAGLVAQGVKDAKIKSFLLNILKRGPVPAATIQKLGASQKFSKMQLWRGKRLIGAVAFKKGWGFEGRWYWARAQHDPNMIKPSRRFTKRLRNLTSSLGYRLHPIGKPPKWGRPRKNDEQKQPADGGGSA
jgi:hypothetical protein